MLRQTSVKARIKAVLKKQQRLKGREAHGNLQTWRKVLV
jgi:hypothetical protein